MERKYTVEELKEMNTDELYLFLSRNYNKVARDVVRDVPESIEWLSIKEWLLFKYRIYDSACKRVVYIGTMEHIDEALASFTPSQILGAKIMEQDTEDERKDLLLVSYNELCGELTLYRTRNYDNSFVHIFKWFDKLNAFQDEYLYLRF